MLLITTFVELRTAVRRSRNGAGRPHAVSGRPMLIHTYHAAPRPRPCRTNAALCRGRDKSLSERHGRGMACVNQTWPHCENQIRGTKSKPLAARHGGGTAWYVWIGLHNTVNIETWLHKLGIPLKFVFHLCSGETSWIYHEVVVFCSSF
jgi:hypothetical protein